MAHCLYYIKLDQDELYNVVVAEAAAAAVVQEENYPASSLFKCLVLLLIPSSQPHQSNQTRLQRERLTAYATRLKPYGCSFFASLTASSIHEVTADGGGLPKNTTKITKSATMIAKKVWKATNTDSDAVTKVLVKFGGDCSYDIIEDDRIIVMDLSIFCPKCHCRSFEHVELFAKNSARNSRDCMNCFYQLFCNFPSEETLFISKSRNVFNLNMLGS